MKKFFKTSAFLVSLLLLCNVVLSQEGMLTYRINDFSGGMDSKSVPDILPPNVGAMASNVVITNRGKVYKRKGESLFNTDTGSTAFTGIGRYDPDSANSYLVVASGGSIAYSTSTDTVWSLVNPASPQSIGYNTEFIQASGLLFVLNGIDNTSWWTGSTWFKSHGFDAASPPSARTAAWLRNFLFLSGSEGQEDWVYVSRNLEPTLFEGDILRINTGDGQPIVRLEPFRLDEVIVYKSRSVFVIDIAGATIDTWNVQPITRYLGCIAPRSVVNLGNDQWFLSSDPIAIRSLVRSEFDKIFLNIESNAVQDIFDGTGALTINKNQIQKAAAVVYDNKYIIAIPTGTSTENNTVLVHDFLTKAWHIITDWEVADWEVFNNRLYFIDSLDGRVMEAYANDTGDFASGPTAITSNSVPDIGIKFNYVSKAIDFDLPENFKKLDSIEAEFNATGNYQAIMSINLDNAGWTSVGTITLSANTITLPVSLPFTLSTDGIARKTFQLEKYGEFKKMQVRIQQEGLSQQAELQRLSIFARPRPWRREQ